MSKIMIIRGGGLSLALLAKIHELLSGAGELVEVDADWANIQNLLREFGVIVFALGSDSVRIVAEEVWLETYIPILFVGGMDALQPYQAWFGVKFFTPDVPPQNTLGGIRPIEELRNVVDQAISMEITIKADWDTTGPGAL